MTILDTLADHARARTERNKGRVSFDEMKMLALSMNADTGYPFEKALGAPGISFICEVKKASPSKGVIAAEFPYLSVAREYEEAGAAAISCLTEPDFFLGSERRVSARDRRCGEDPRPAQRLHGGSIYDLRGESDGGFGSSAYLRDPFR